MRHIRTNWLAGLPCQQFLALDPWEFVCHDESRSQWIAEVRKVLTVRLRDDEILSVLYPGLYDATSAAIRNHDTKSAADRGRCLIGYALSYIRLYGLALVLEETPGASSYSFAELDTVSDVPRAHALEHEYMQTSSNYIDGLQSAPQFLSDGVVLSDEGLQARHQHIETLRRFLSPREHQILRLAVLEQHRSVDMSEMLGLSQKQTWKVRRGLLRKLADIAIDQGVCPKYAASLRPRMATAEAE